MHSTITNMVSFVNRRPLANSPIGPTSGIDGITNEIPAIKNKEVTFGSTMDERVDEPRMIISDDGNKPISTTQSVSSSSSFDGSSISTMPSAALSSIGDNKKSKKKSKKKGGKSSKKLKINLEKILSDNVEELQQELKRTQINHFHLGREFEELTMERMEMEEKVESQQQTIALLHQELAAAKGDAKIGDDTVAMAKTLATIRHERDEFKKENEDLKACVVKAGAQLAFLTNLAMNNPTLTEGNQDTSVAVDVKSGWFRKKKDRDTLHTRERDRPTVTSEELGIAEANIRELQRCAADLQQALDDKKELQKELAGLSQESDRARTAEEKLLIAEATICELRSCSTELQNVLKDKKELQKEVERLGRERDRARVAEEKLLLADAKIWEFRCDIAELKDENKKLQNEVELLTQERDRARAAENDMLIAEAKNHELLRISAELQQAMDDKKELQKEVELLQQDLEDCAAGYEEEIAALEGVNERTKDALQQKAKEIQHLERQLMIVSKQSDSITSATASMSSSIASGFLDSEDLSNSSGHEVTHKYDDRAATITMLKMQNESLLREQQRMRDDEQNLLRRNATQMETYKILEKAMNHALEKADKQEAKFVETIRRQNVSLDSLYRDLAEAKKNVQALEATLEKLEVSNPKRRRYNRLVDELHLIECTSKSTSVDATPIGAAHDGSQKLNLYGLGNAIDRTSMNETNLSTVNLAMSSDTGNATGELPQSQGQGDMLANLMAKKKIEQRGPWLRLGSRFSAHGATNGGVACNTSLNAPTDANAEDKCKALEEENQKLKSSLVRLQSYHKGVLYKQKLVVTELRSANEALILKTAALEEQHRLDGKIDSN